MEKGGHTTHLPGERAGRGHLEEDQPPIVITRWRPEPRRGRPPDIVIVIGMDTDSIGGEMSHTAAAGSRRLAHVTSTTPPPRDRSHWNTEGLDPV